MQNLNQVGNNTYYIKGHANTGIYDMGGGDVILFDTGATVEEGELIIEVLKSHGWKPSLILYTHAHHDHVAGHGLITNEYGIKGYCSPEEVLFGQNRRYFNNSLYGGPMPKGIDEASNPPVYLEYIKDCHIPDGIECLSCPGHNLGDLIYKTPDDVWFIGDALIPRRAIEKSRIAYEYDFPKHVESLNLLGSLGSVPAVMGHGAPEEDLAWFADYTRDIESATVEEVLWLCNEPVSRDDIIKYFLDKSADKYAFKRYNTLHWTFTGILTFLVNKDMVTCSMENNRQIFKRL